MSRNSWWSLKVGVKVLYDLAICSIFFTEIPLNFHDSIQVVPLKYSMYFLAGTNAK